MLKPATYIAVETTHLHYTTNMFWPMSCNTDQVIRGLHMYMTVRVMYTLTFRRRIKSRLPFAGIIRRLSYSTHFQDKG
jgi:hypothetical protein